eukprot:9318353-Pyramimonas_sp.AAC.1
MVSRAPQSTELDAIHQLHTYLTSGDCAPILWMFAVEKRTLAYWLSAASLGLAKTSSWSLDVASTT